MLTNAEQHEQQGICDTNLFAGIMLAKATSVVRMVAKKMSPSNSRRFRQMGSSRNAMSMDSSQHNDMSQGDITSIVHRQPFHIRVLSQMEEILDKNKYEGNTLDLLKTRSYGHVMCLDSTIFIKT